MEISNFLAPSDTSPHPKQVAFDPSSVIPASEEVDEWIGLYLNHKETLDFNPNPNPNST